MKRFIDHDLLAWKNETSRKPLLVQGARQIGKTYAIRELGKTYKNFVEINFERHPELIPIFDYNLDPKRIIKELSEKLGVVIDFDTLLFFDEIQIAPKIIIALRYFYEEMPQLAVIAAGSLLDFAIQQVGMPVGRIMFLYMYPVSFLEFLYAINQEVLMKQIMASDPQVPFDDTVHKKLLTLVGQYIAIGGMPAVITKWHETASLADCAIVQAQILDTYRYDFDKYAKKFQIKYLNDLFKFVPRNLGARFKYESVPGQYRKQELAPCLDLLETAGIIHKIIYSVGHGIPVGALANHDLFKVIFLDVALSSSMLDLNMGDWLTAPLEQLSHKGGLVEAFIGQELLAYSSYMRKKHLYFWQKETKDCHAEVDYLIQKNEFIIPIEVKAGLGSTLHSLRTFLENHPDSPYGIRFSSQNFSVHEKIHSYPLYAVAKLFNPRFL